MGSATENADVETILRTVASVAAELRHAYMHLAGGMVIDQRSLANGLIAPQIRRLEQLTGTDQAKREAKAGAGRGGNAVGVAVAAYNEVWQGWKSIHAGNVDEVRREAMAAAIGAVFGIDSFHVARLRDIQGAPLSAAETSGGNQDRDTYEMVGALRAAFGDDFHLEASSLIIQGGPVREGLARLEPGNLRRPEVGAPETEVDASIVGHGVLAAELHRKWVDAGMPDDPDYEDGEIMDAASIRHYAKKNGLWPEGEDDDGSLFATVLEYCRS